MKKSYHSSADPTADAIITLRCEASIVLPLLLFSGARRGCAARCRHRGVIAPRFSVFLPESGPEYRRAGRAASCVASQPEIAQARVIVGTTAGRPVKFPLRRRNRQVVDAGDAPLHQPLLVEFPVFVAVGAEPVSGIIVPFV